MACVTVFYINGHASLLPKIFQIKTAEAHSQPCWVSEMELFTKMINFVKPLSKELHFGCSECFSELILSFNFKDTINPYNCLFLLTSYVVLDHHFK